MTQSFVFTSESVTGGHPDKVADGISDAILDAHLAADVNSRVACETLVATGLAMIAGEITSDALLPIADIVRDKIKRLGYTDAELGFSADSCAVMISLNRQSPDIARGVNVGEGLYKEQGAGDQGMMFGYACDETPDLMPLPISLAHRLTKALTRMRETGKLPFLRPDGKSQVSVVYENGRPRRVDTVVVSTQHAPDTRIKTIREALIEEVIKKQIPTRWIDKNTRFLINPTGRFVVGGPHGDTGLTGRKIIADTYGGMGRHGGGAFSGKDPSKVDRSAAYMARYVAKNIVAAKLASRCEIALSYAIGYPEPISVHVDTFGTGVVPAEQLDKAVRGVFGLKPAEIIEQLDLLRPIFEATSAYGHFGRNRETDVFTWEKTDKTDELCQAVKMSA